MSRVLTHEVCQCSSLTVAPFVLCLGFRSFAFPALPQDPLFPADRCAFVSTALCTGGVLSSGVPGALTILISANTLQQSRAFNSFCVFSHAFIWG